MASGALEGADTIRIAIALSDTDIERIAGRTAELLRADRSRRPDESPYLTIEEAAAYVRCRRQRVDDLLSQRRLSRIKDGSRTLIARAELEAYLRRNDGDPSAARWGSAA